jgi:hypothetical protein
MVGKFGNNGMKVVLSALVVFLFALLAFAESSALSLSDFGTGVLKIDFGKGEWVPFTDKDNGGTSKMALSFVEGKKSKKALNVAYELGKDYEYRYVTLKLAFKEAVDISKYKSISFWIKGSGSSIRFSVCAADVKDYDYHGYPIAATSGEWKEVRLPFTSLIQEGWGAKKDLDLSKTVVIQFQTASKADGEKGNFAVDKVELSTEKVSDPNSARVLTDVLNLSDFAKQGLNLIDLSAKWMSRDDSLDGGTSQSKMSFGNGQTKGEKTLRLDYELASGFKDRYAMVGVSFAIPIDLSKYRTLSFWMRGSGNKIRVYIGTKDVEDFDYHNYLITATSGKWKQYKLSFAELTQEGWGKSVVFDPEKISTIQFKTASKAVGEKGWFEIDKVTLTK